jgi:serine phosphatase RsbU (regulator of sigma subunit)
VSEELGRDKQRLANLHALTDTSLTKLGIDDFLVELLSRVRDILDADTAAVLLVDETSRYLVARAAVGIEEEVRQGVQIPLGAGFAGRIAATKGPIRLDAVNPTTVANPILWQTGIKVMLGVPLLSNEVLLGVLHVGRLEDRPFTERDLELLQVVAERIGAALVARQRAVERAAVALLERSLVPSALPAVPGFEISARYVPAEGRTVGGDWYDLFTLPSGELWIVAGDVAGHGLQAAVVMGRIRSALRAYAMLDVPPERVLELVDHKVDHFEMGTIATVICGTMKPPYEVMTLSSAGHLPPVAARPDEAAFFANVDTGPPLGVRSDGGRASTSLALAPGTVVAFYTDGLVERRTESIETGMERLRASITTQASDIVAREAMANLVSNVIPEDDIALVVLRRLPENVPE